MVVASIATRPSPSGGGGFDGLSARCVDPEDAVEAGDLEDPDDVLVAADDVQIAVPWPHAFCAAHKDSQRGGVDECHLGEVDDDSVGATFAVSYTHLTLPTILR